MSARDTILVALTAYYGRNADPRGTAVQALDGYDADRRDYLLGERSDVRDRMVRDAQAAGRAEALAEADLLPKADVVAWLLKRAHEYPTGSPESVPDAIVRIASKVERGAVRPDNVSITGGTVLTVPVHATGPADFFQPGHTYAYDADGFTAPELLTLFRVVADTTHPQTGKRMAFGWIRTAEDVAWSAYAEPVDEWPACWTDVTGSGGAS